MAERELVLNDSIGYLANRAARALINDLNKNFAAAGLAITVEQWRVLVHLRDKDGLTQNELSDRLLQEKTGVSRLIDGLEKRSLVVRVPDEADRRNKRVYLSTLGQSLQNLFVEQAQLTLSKAQDGVPDDALDVCREVLRRIIENLLK